MRPEDEAQIVAYATRPGLKRLTPLTRDKQVLLAAIDATDEARTLLDPWPMGLPCLQTT